MTDVRYDLKNNSGIPMDVETPDGPRILPASGVLEGVRLDALNKIMFETSPIVELSEATEEKAVKEKATPPEAAGASPSGAATPPEAGADKAGEAHGRPAAAAGADAKKGSK